MIEESMHKGTYSGKILLSSFGSSHTASITKYNPKSFNDKLHAHENAHFSYLFDGGCVEKKRSSYEICPGNITYYEAGEKHQVTKVAKDTTRINLEFEDSFLKQYNISSGHMRTAVYRNPEARFLLMKVYRELVIDDSLSDLSLQMLCLELTVPKFVHPKNGNSTNWLENLEEYLRCTLPKKLSLDQLSEVCNLHPVTVSKGFATHFNCTLGQFKRKLMVERALPMVSSSELSLCEIALECGFFDQSHFTRTFKELIGCSPKTYRKFKKDF
ncbi:AraC family transcriptional regulator [Ulvibacterium marinum]|uniref:AraC family transcriptional regulator n=1 Tax=Ulvibacterium marinum TaxID=2419782 RepID=A0A3B0CDW0_9FLAO|nr:AraC family transcriptional regulator [Ulvibacterium marinum]RKN83550.1 AraC family transcriptional regulator [Ulvibacterium marinum]